MPRKLSDTRIRILRRLAERDVERDGAESAREIAVGCGEGRRASGWATGALREMAAGYSGPPLVERHGTFADRAFAWTITDAGRAALAEAEGAVPATRLEEGR